MIDLTTSYLGLPLTGPVIASAGPLTGRLDDLLRLEAAGVSAAVLPSLFEEEVPDEDLRYEAGTRSVPSLEHPAICSPLTEFLALGPERHVRLMAEAKHVLSIPLIASINVAHTGPWHRYVTMMAEAGADAIELNIYTMATDPTRSAAQVEAEYLDVVREARAAVAVPLAVKLSPYFTSLPHLAAAVVRAGADGLVLFNRYYQPRLNLRTRSATPTVQMSVPNELRLPLRWLSVLRPQLPGTSLAASSGVYGVGDVVSTLLAGADVACMTSVILRRGPHHVQVMLDGVATWLEQEGYSSIAQLRGSAGQLGGSTGQLMGDACSTGAEDSGCVDRANYVAALSRFQSIVKV